MRKNSVGNRFYTYHYRTKVVQVGKNTVKHKFKGIVLCDSRMIGCGFKTKKVKLLLIGNGPLSVVRPDDYCDIMGNGLSQLGEDIV